MSNLKENVSVGQTIFKSLQKFGDRILLYDTDNDKTIRYLDILSQSIRTALKLKEKGITRKDIIAMCCHNHQYSCVPVIATQFLAALTANFDPNLVPKEIEHFLKVMQPKIIFVSEESLDLMERCLQNTGLITELVVFGKSEKHMQFSEFLQENIEEQHFLPVEISDVQDTAIIFFSSGTTGLPKGICQSHLSIRWFGECFPPFAVTNKNPISLTFATFYWISTTFNLISCITRGNSAAICKEYNPKATWKLIEKLKITFMLLPPHSAIAFLNEDRRDVEVSSLEVIVLGGSIVSPKLMKAFQDRFPNAKIINVYSQTEFGDLPCMFNPLIEEEYKMQILKPRSHGKFKPHVEWKFVDTDTEEIVGPNQRGELRIKSPYLMNGYYKMDTSFVYDSDGFLKSGDVGYYDEDHCVYIVDRIKEMFKYRGWHIVPAELEEVLLSHPAVNQAAVLGVPHEVDGDHPMAFVSLSNGYGDTKAEEILNFVNKKLSDTQKLRAGIKVLDSLPATPTGKINRSMLKKIIFEHVK